MDDVFTKQNVTVFQEDFSKVEQCPKFSKCNAPVCPIEPKWQKIQHISGDRVCFYLIEAQKPNAKAVFEGRGLGYLYEVILRLTPEIASTYSVIKTAMEKSKISSSRMTRKFRDKRYECDAKKA